jgi:hypothetical protein
MIWIALAFVSIFFYEVQAQNACLHLMENSIKMKNDTLYFKCKIQNNGPSICKKASIKYN